jgi:hypothetical protein
MASLSQGLKTPGLIDKESDLPDASTVDNGTYYVVQDLDVTAPGQQGRVWKNDTLSPTDWQIVVDNVAAPDEEWIGLTQGGALTVSAAIQALINGAVQGSQKGAAHGVASLDENTKIPVEQLPIDNTPTAGSGNPVSSDGVKAANDGKQDALTTGQLAAVDSGITAGLVTTFGGKQDALESGTNIKTINNTSILGSGNINVAASNFGGYRQDFFNVASGAQFTLSLNTS